MNFQDIIFKKRDGYELTGEEISHLVNSISDGTAPDYQIAAWAMAVFFRGLNERETRDLAIAMAYSGEVADLSAIAGIKVDKHSTGGVGDKTTMVVIPLVAAAGVPVAKMSGRGLGHTGGTIDKYESIPGFKTERTYQQFIAQVNQIKAAVISQSGNLVPADKRLYAIRDVTATVDSIPLIASSVMSKKIASGAQAIVLDVKAGSGAFMKNAAEAIRLAEIMVKIGRGAGRRVVAVISAMNQPLGNTVGNALEVREAIDTLKGKGPQDLEELSLYLAAQMVWLGGGANQLEDARQMVNGLLKSGAGWQKFREMVNAQEGKMDYQAENYGLPQAKVIVPVKSDQEGYVAGLDAFEIGRTAMLLGAGRERQEDRIDHAVGIELVKKTGDYVNRGDILALIHANDENRLMTAVSRLPGCYCFNSLVPEKKPLVIETITD